MAESRKFEVQWASDPCDENTAYTDWVVADHHCAAATMAYLAWANARPVEAAAIGAVTVGVREGGARHWRKIRVTPEIVASAREVANG